MKNVKFGSQLMRRFFQQLSHQVVLIHKSYVWKTFFWWIDHCPPHLNLVDTLGLERYFWKQPINGDLELKKKESTLNLELETLVWAIESMLNVYTCQNFKTDCMYLINMTREPEALPNFSTIKILQSRLQDFKICYILERQN